MATQQQIGPIIYRNGPVHCSVCVPKEMPREEVERFVNSENPTGIPSSWKISNDMAFAEGSPNPCPCEREPQTRLHYLMVC